MGDERLLLVNHRLSAIMQLHQVLLAVLADFVLKAEGADRHEIGRLLGVYSEITRAGVMKDLDGPSREFLESALNSLMAEYGPSDGAEPDPDPSGDPPRNPGGWFPRVIDGGRQ